MEAVAGVVVEDGVFLQFVFAVFAAAVLEVVDSHGFQTKLSTVRCHAMACPALPTCGLAITESERAFPNVVGQLENEIARLGLTGEELTVRMTGCPNGCARPYTADIGLVGKAVGKYTICLGGGIFGDRLNRVYKEMVPLEDVVDELLPILTRFKLERRTSERFGDFCHRSEILPESA